MLKTLLKGLTDYVKYVRFKKHVNKPGNINRRTNCILCEWTTFDKRVYVISACDGHRKNPWWPKHDTAGEEIIVFKTNFKRKILSVEQVEMINIVSEELQEKIGGRDG